MSIEIRRFGVGHRRPDGPAGTTGVTGQSIHADGRGTVSEVAFARGARMEPHASPNTTWFVVIEGGGWIGVGEERTRIAAGEAVLWPADVPHAAWTEHSEMRAFTIEFPGADDSAALGIIEGGRAIARPALAVPAERGEGALIDDRARRPDPDAGEPA